MQKWKAPNNPAATSVYSAATQFTTRDASSTSSASGSSTSSSNPSRRSAAAPIAATAPVQSTSDDHHRIQQSPADLQIRSGRLRLRRRRRHAAISVFCAFEDISGTPAARRTRFANSDASQAPLHDRHRHDRFPAFLLHANCAPGQNPDRQRPLPASDATRRPPGDLPNTPKPPPENNKIAGFQIGSRPNRRRKIASTTSSSLYSRRA